MNNSLPFSAEYVGYFASILIAISLTMSSVLRLRLINLCGGLTFVIYGLFIDAWPVVFLNALTSAVNVYYLYKLFTTRTYFDLLSVSSGSAYLQYFLDFYRGDIESLIPTYRFEPADNQLIVFILRDMVPAGLLIGEVKQGSTFHIYLDYVIPSYRDFKIGSYLYRDSELFDANDITRLVSSPNNALHLRYLRRMGFQREDIDFVDDAYVLHLQ